MPAPEIFSGGGLDREGDRRSDPAWLSEQRARADGLTLVFWNGAPLVAPEAGGALRLVYLQPDAAEALAGASGPLVFLGLEGAAPIWAADLTGPAQHARPLADLGLFEPLREAAERLPPAETGRLACARSLFNWRQRHGFCSVCGQPTVQIDGGWKRRCLACQAEHFPRVDPCVIMLPTFGDRCLLGRQAAWPQGRFSALAGFVEPGETLDEACVREVKEEAGLTVVAVRHHSSQPWPFPSNLMIGLIAEVADDQAAADGTELEAVRWLSRAQARDLLAGRLEGMQPPGTIAIARRLLVHWAEAED